ncbi:MAG: thioredoxin [Opitutaceae bacterium]|nr:thioredoxin [Opitutaceae bacterium]
MSANTTELNSSNFKSSIDSATPTLVDFWAPWCGPCKAISPILEELGAELKGRITIGKLNVDDNGAISSEYNVRAIPTLILFKAGKVVDTYVGMKSKAFLKEQLIAKV